MTVWILTSTCTIVECFESMVPGVGKCQGCAACFFDRTRNPSSRSSDLAYLLLKRSFISDLSATMVGACCLLLVLAAGASALSAELITESRRRSSLRTWGGGEKEIGWTVERRRIQVQDDDDDADVLLGNQIEVSIGIPNERSVEEDDEDDVLKVVIPSDGDGGVSSSLWPAALAGSILLRRQKLRSTLVDKDILELGSGLGLAGLVAASAPAKSCTLTDKVDEAVELLQNTVIHNSFDGCNLDSRRLDWKDTDSYGDTNQVDVVLGTDLAYYYFLLRPLMDASRACMKRQNGLLYIAGQSNRESLWDLYNNIIEGCYNQLTDEKEPPWEGETKMLLYDLRVGPWVDNSNNDEGDDEIQQKVPIAVLIHSTDEGRIAPMLNDDDHIATKLDEENQMYTF